MSSLCWFVLSMIPLPPLLKFFTSLTFPIELACQPHPLWYSTTTFVLFINYSSNPYERIHLFINALSVYEADCSICLHALSKPLTDRAYSWYSPSP